MNDNVNLQKIKDRIAKLLRMADDASSPNEAAIAATRARKLMDQYQLDHLDIGGGFDEEFGTGSVGRFYAAFPQHMSFFAVHVAKYNDCQVTLERGEVTHRRAVKNKRNARDGGQTDNWGLRPQFRGYKSDVELACQMYDTLLEAVDRFRAEYLKDKGYAKYPVGVGKAFNIAAIEEIGARIKAMTAEREQLMTDAKAGTSLIVVKEKSVAAHFGEIKYGKAKTNLQNDADANAAHEAGKRAGRKIEITRQID